VDKKSVDPFWTALGLLAGPSGLVSIHGRSKSVSRAPTRIRLVAVGDGDLTIVGGVEENDGSNGAKVLGVLDLETTEKAAVADQCDLALDLNSEIDKSLEILDGATAAKGQLNSPEACFDLTYPA
jgi:hypothetical protein